MKSLPDKIEKCPITEAIFELRFTSDFPDEAIFGIIYAEVKDDFKEGHESLPILQLPEKVRAQDPGLMYKAHHRLAKGNMVLNIGPRVLSFANSDIYTGWAEWSKFFNTILNKIEKTNVLTNIERIGLRYINIFSDNIFDKVKLEVKIDNKILSDESTNLRTEIIDGQYINILQVGNSLNITKNNQDISGSIIDIDCIYNVENTTEFLSDRSDIIEGLHNNEKKLFFSILKESFLEELKPTYGDEP
ncbi:MAG: TIGR04255 family protein [Chlorobi bacterium]|nr:TIGR04255 family protein [Chlorobiota bacterium]